MHSLGTMAIHSHHDPMLVVLSIIIAVAASYTALDLASRIKASEGSALWRWIGAGAVTLGGGIWSMHFVSMLALNLDRPVAYDVWLTGASLIAAIAVVGVGFFVVSRDHGGPYTLGAAGLFAGAGIATMHYVGMAAMRLDATIRYDPTLVAASIVIAIVASIVAFWLAFRLDKPLQRAAGGVVMGFAIAGMHYTAMAAATFSPLPESAFVDEPSDTIPLLAAVIAVATFGILMLALLSSTTARKFAAQIEREATVVRQNERRLRTIIDTALDAFIAIDVNGNVTSWSARAEQTFGWTANEAMGRELTTLIMPQRFREAHRHGLRRFVETGENRVLNQRLELAALHKDGHEFPVELTISAMTIDDRLVISSFIHDISDRKKAENDLIAAKDQAEAASRAKSVFLANMSHELRTPLNAIIGFSEIIQDGLGSPGASHREYAADINHAGKHLLDLINDILDLSKADDGTLELRSEICEVSELINFGVDSVRNAAAMAGIDIALVNPTGMPRLYVDPRRVRQVLVNILSNAVKFTPRDGRVSIAAMLEQDGRLALSVDDTGIGMTEAQIKTAMAPFDQVDNRLSRRFEGVGLGLPLTQRLMSLHDGMLDIVSQKDRGTRVIIRFPASRIRPALPPAIGLSA